MMVRIPLAGMTTSRILLFHAFTHYRLSDRPTLLPCIVSWFNKWVRGVI